MRKNKTTTMDITKTPTNLFVGQEEQLHTHIEQLLKTHFCKDRSHPFDCARQELAPLPPSLKLLRTCKANGIFCSECRKIKNKQHSLITWICPEKNYTVNDIEIIFDRTRFALDEDQHSFFVLDRAHTLTTATANRLLKVLEEPPTGYHFWLLTTNAQVILPTIRSRSIEISVNTGGQSTLEPATFHNPLLDYFLHPEKRKDPFEFEKELKKQRLTNTQSTELAHTLIALFIQQLKTCITDDNGDEKQKEHLTQILKFLTQTMRKPPQSGSSELFWKHLFLIFPKP